jgi:hypothetical protein
MTAVDSTTPDGQRKYYNLVLFDAIACGWASSLGLSLRETQVLLWIAKRGILTEENFVGPSWFTPHGQAEWAACLHMSHDHLRKVLERLRRKGLLTDVRSRRFRKAPGYGIPIHVIDDAQRWCDEPSHYESEDVTAGHMECDDLSHENPYDPYGSRAIGPQGYIPNLERRETMPLKGEASGLPEKDWETPPPVTQWDYEKHQEEWFDPKGEGEDLEWSRPRDNRTPQQRQPTTRLAGYFWERWLHSRESNTMLALPWSTKKGGFMKNLKLMLLEYSERELYDMIDRFFTWGVDQKGLVLKSDELWLDFLFAKAKLYQQTRRPTIRDYTAHNAALEDE